MRTRVWALAVLPCTLATLGCGGATATTPPRDAGSESEAGQTSVDGGTACSGDGECGSGQICAYLENARCEAHGQCLTNLAGEMCIDAFACGCDGGTIHYNVTCSPGVSGYVSTPILHLGACGSDGG